MNATTMPPLLTPDSIASVLSGRRTSSDDYRPIVQVFDLKPLKAKEGEARRFRLLIADGSHAAHGLFAGELNAKCESEEITKFTVLRVDDYTVQDVNGKKCARDARRESRCVRETLENEACAARARAFEGSRGMED